MVDVTKLINTKGLVPYNYLTAIIYISIKIDGIGTHITPDAPITYITYTRKGRFMGGGEMLEKDIEKILVGEVKKLGSRAYKWVSPATMVCQTGLWFSNRPPIFVELKK